MQTRRFDDHRQGIRSILLVGSGKGGVGKSSVAAALALRLHALGNAVGLLDADLQGPSIPVLFGVAGPPLVRSGRIVPLERWHLKLMSTGFLAGDDKAFPWAGPFIAGVLRQFIRDVDWGPLDFLVVDLPPGTGDVHKVLLDLVSVDGIVIVTTPHAMAEADVRRALSMYTALGVPVMGLVENMAVTLCPCCGESHKIFRGDAGENLAVDLSIEEPLRLPIEQGAVESCRSMIPTSAFADRIDRLARRVARSLHRASHAQPRHSDASAVTVASHED